MLLPIKHPRHAIWAQSSRSVGWLRVRTTPWPLLSWGQVSASASRPPWTSAPSLPWSPPLASYLFLGRRPGSWRSGPGPGIQRQKESKMSKENIMILPSNKRNCFFYFHLKSFHLFVQEESIKLHFPFLFAKRKVRYSFGIQDTVSPSIFLFQLHCSFSLAFNISNSLPHVISHLSPFLWSWFIQRERMVSIIYSIPTHLWPWLMHHWPNRSLCQAVVEYSTHTCKPAHPHTQKITGQRVHACTHIHSLSLSASPMDTWQQEFTVMSLNWSQIIAVLKWLNLI